MCQPRKRSLYWRYLTTESRACHRISKKFEPLIGKWRNKEEMRQTQEADWQTGTSEWEFRSMPGGYFVETPGRFDIEGMGPVTFIQIYGWDTVNEDLVSWSVSSDGYRWEMTSGHWDGTVLFERWVGISPEGDNVVDRCRWEHTPDFRSVKGTCERLSDGIWWTMRKVEGAKVE